MPKKKTQIFFFKWNKINLVAWSRYVLLLKYTNNLISSHNEKAVIGRICHFSFLQHNFDRVSFFSHKWKNTLLMKNHIENHKESGNSKWIQRVSIRKKDLFNPLKWFSTMGCQSFFSSPHVDFLGMRLIFAELLRQMRYHPKRQSYVVSPYHYVTLSILISNK